MINLLLNVSRANLFAICLIVAWLLWCFFVVVVLFCFVFLIKFKEKRRFLSSAFYYFFLLNSA